MSILVIALSAMQVLLCGVVVFFLATFLLVVLPFFRAWLAAVLCGVKVRMSELVAMRLRKVPYRRIVDTAIIAVQQGLTVSIKEIKEHWIAGGHPIQTVRAFANVRRAGIGNVDWRQMCAIDLAAKDTNDEILGLAAAAVSSTTVEVRDLDVKTRDGMPFKVSIRIVYRLILDRYLGNLRDVNEMAARVSQAMIAAIDSVESQKWLIEHPDLVGNEVLNLRLDADTAFEILSVNILNVDISGGQVLVQEILSPEEESQIIPAQADLRYVDARQLREGRVKLVVAGEIREFDIYRSFHYQMIRKAFRDYHTCIVDAIIKDGPQRNNYWARELFGPLSQWDRMPEWERRAFLKILVRKRGKF